MKVSVVIPVKNDFEYLADVLMNLVENTDPHDLEIILVNDGSINDNGTLKSIDVYKMFSPNLKIIDNSKNYGVGYSMDRGAEEASGDIIILTACDVFPKGRSWLVDVVDAVQSHPNELGCSTCLGLNPENMDMDREDIVKRYGANLLWIVGINDLPDDSKLRKTIGGYTSILEAKWNNKLLSENPFKIPCVYGALYFCTKEFYQKMHGFDTVKGEQFRGHMKWSNLEPMISLKAQMYGNGCRVYPNIEAGHIFGRKTEGARSMEYQYWNKLWIAYTMLEESFRDELRNFLNHNLNYSIAQHWIRQHKDVVNEVRERNLREAKLISRLC